MNQQNRHWALSWIVLAAAGIAVMGIGLYFIFLRLPLLPEDLRYMGLSAAQLDIVRSHFAEWLTHVFIVLGGYAMATAVLAITLAATSFRAQSRGAAVGATIGGAASIGLMAAVNFAIRSDFKWVLLGIALGQARCVACGRKGHFMSADLTLNLSQQCELAAGGFEPRRIIPHVTCGQMYQMYASPR